MTDEIQEGDLVVFRSARPGKYGKVVEVYMTFGKPPMAAVEWNTGSSGLAQLAHLRRVSPLVALALEAGDA